MKVDVRLAQPDELELCFEIRRQVFVDEQAVSREEEFDGLDSGCLHFIARYDDRAVGTARMLLSKGEAKAQRVAVLPAARRSGVGQRLMSALESEASERGCARVILHAQTRSVSFYEAIGYTAEGRIFVEAEIPHRFMWKSLSPP